MQFQWDSEDCKTKNDLFAFVSPYFLQRRGGLGQGWGGSLSRLVIDQLVGVMGPGVLGKKTDRGESDREKEEKLTQGWAPLAHFSDRAEVVVEVSTLLMHMMTNHATCLLSDSSTGTYCVLHTYYLTHIHT